MTDVKLKLITWFTGAISLHRCLCHKDPLVREGRKLVVSVGHKYNGYLQQS